MTATLTGKGDSKWTVEVDETAPSKLRVLKQSGRVTFPLLLKDDTAIEDGFLEAKFKAIAGSEDRAAGLVWRARAANNYYVIRANALADNVVLYKTINGAVRLTLLGAREATGLPFRSQPTDGIASGSTSKASASGRPTTAHSCSRVEDSTFKNAGKVGLWTKADSVTLFDQITYGETK